MQPEQVLRDRERLVDSYKTELKQQIAEKKRDLEKQKRKEAEEDARLEQKIEDYYEEIRKRDEKLRQGVIMPINIILPNSLMQPKLRVGKIVKKPFVEISEAPKPSRRLRELKFESYAPLKPKRIIKPPTPAVERHDPEITLAAKLNRNGGLVRLYETGN